jgi:hypothetical protein
MSNFLFEQYQTIARYFFLKFFGIELENIVVDDETTIFDLLEKKKEIQKLKDDMKSEYKIDFSDLEDLKLIDIFQRIELLK